MPHRIDQTDPKKVVWGGAAVIVIVLLAAAFWYFLDSRKDVPHSATTKIEEIYKGARDKVKDAGAEVPQAVKDSTQVGDQNTTRPNKDGSTEKLDQK
jgi:hypothetical protein